ncbi:MAG: rhomboid family intramembrane serine protease [Pseudomonadales bacterium]|nr:rhomboid family intramembrane serine protease [Pseudomonadales bacterium]
MSRIIPPHWFAAAKLILALVAVLWVVELANYLVGHRLNSYGIYPRRVESLPGLIIWPFLHGNFYHLALNTMPLLVLGFFVALYGRMVFLKASIIILLLGGAGVWIFGRAAYHVGASGLVFGLFGFLILLAYYQRSLKTFGLAFLAIFLYGGMIWGILPQDRFVSWEGHLFGLLAGALSAKLLAK